eukprot:TRINITY_DN34068_c0_g2_i1.p1 TRINITY_DN34068_c0_g2~~TRINITY_DN34068_c0_g2_i1.p1  ORF type:complete len:320 (-),score=67.54 TRINITY_DN34068_c0_g2_i1:449-1381(-)
MVALMVSETWIMSIVLAFTTVSDGSTKQAMLFRMLRLLRLLRMARLARLLRAVPELMILIKGMMMAARSVLLALALMTVIVYVFGIAMTRLVENGDARDLYWHNVSLSMKTLFLHCCLLEGLPHLVDVTAKSSILGSVCILIFVVLSSLVVMNMLVGVLCEVVTCVAAIERETLQVQYVRDHIQGICREMKGGLDEAEISFDEFKELLQIPAAARALVEVDVDVVGLVDYADFLFGSQSQITLEDLMTTILELRGTNKATVRDVVQSRKSLMSELTRVERSMLDAVGKPMVVSKDDISRRRREHAKRMDC